MLSPHIIDLLIALSSSLWHQLTFFKKFSYQTEAHASTSIQVLMDIIGVTITVGKSITEPILKQRLLTVFFLLSIIHSVICNSRKWCHSRLIIQRMGERLV
jgi:hypothetical protein